MASATYVVFMDDPIMDVVFYSVDFFSGLCPHLCRQYIFNQTFV